MSWSHLRSVRVWAGMALVIAAAAVGIDAAFGAAAGGTAAGGQEIASVSPGPGHELRANGLDAARAVPVFELSNGDSAGVVAGNGVRCVVRTREGRESGEVCAAEGEAASGVGISVSDECSTGGRNLMEIVGVAPSGTTQVELTVSDGTTQTAPVVDGAFKFDGTNPGAGDSYPTGVQWLAGSGASAGAAPLPVSGRQFCLAPQ